jgi:F0F1-type ATP synthase assembly protein I
MKYTALAFQIVGAMVFFIFAGYYLDKWVQLKFPLFLLSFSILGIVAVMVILFRMVGKRK